MTIEIEGWKGLNETTSLEIVINHLIFPLLNSVHMGEPESVEEAVDMLSSRIRFGLLGVTLGLCEVANAIREQSSKEMDV